MSPPKEETPILRTALPTPFRQSFTFKIIVGCRQIVVLVGHEAASYGSFGAEKEDVELRIELARDERQVELRPRPQPPRSLFWVSGGSRNGAEAS